MLGFVLEEEKQIPGGNDRKKGNGKSKGQYRGPSLRHAQGQDDDEKRTTATGSGYRRAGQVRRSLGGEEVALIEETGGLRVGLGFEDEARAQGFWLGFDRRGRGGDGFGMVGRGGLREQVGEGAEFAAESGDLVAAVGFLADGFAYVDDWGGLGRGGWDGSGGELGGFGGFFGFGLGGEGLAGAGDGVALVVEQALDAESHFDVALAVEALAGAALVGLELRELGLPETQDVGGDIAQLRYIANAEVELVRNDGWLGGNCLTNWMM